MSRERELPAIVLVRPRNPLNIGAAARAMANFGFSDLRVVSPHPPVWREALDSAVGARSVLRGAKLFAGLAEATADRRFVLGASSLKGRRPRLPVRELPGLSAGEGWAVLFGPEKTGLGERDLASADAVLRIPTEPGCPSMNLGQSVAVVCYEWASRSHARPQAEPARIDSAELERLIGRCAGALGKLRYRPALDDGGRGARLRRLLRPRGVSPGEAGLLYEVLRRIEELP